MNQKQRQRHRKKLREAHQRAALAKSLAPSPLKSLDALPSGIRRSFVGSGPKLDATSMKGSTHTGFRDPKTGHREGKKAKQFKAFTYSAQSYDKEAWEAMKVEFPGHKPEPKRNDSVKVRIGTSPERKLIIEDKETGKKKRILIPEKPKYMDVGASDSIPNKEGKYVEI